MPGKGPPPKLGDKLGHISRSERNARKAYDEIAELAEEVYEPRPCPRGEWHHKARAWWKAAADSLGARVLWMDEDWETAERCMVLVNRFWLEDRSTQLAALSGEIRRLEVQLYLTPAERVRHNLKRGEDPVKGSAERHPSSAGEGVRARLRALDGGSAG